MRRTSLALIMFGWILAACSARSASLAAFFPAANAVPGLAPAEDVAVYGTKNLYDLVDGAAEGYLAYGCDQVGVRRYAAAGQPALKVEVWQLASPADAYGLFTTLRSGDPVAIGSEGLLHPGRQVIFWQNRYYVRVSSLEGGPQADLQALARAVSGLLPAGGDRPALLGRLPPESLVPGSPLFFRSELSIQGRLWLGGENLLKLGPQTEGVLADYTLDGGDATLLLVRYPRPDAAANALAALRSAQIEQPTAARANGDLLGAVFGGAGPAAAENLVGAAVQ